MVGHPADYQWSSFSHHGMSRTDPLIQDHALYIALGQNEAARCRAYRALFENPLPEKALQSIRASTNGGWVLGNDRFRGEIEAAAERRAGPAHRGGSRKGAGRPKINRT
jgi:putative transposase